LVEIFRTLLFIYGDIHEDEKPNLDIIKGLENLAKINDSKSIQIVSGIGKQSDDQPLLLVICEMLNRKNEDIYSCAIKYIGSILVSDDIRIPELLTSFNILDKLNSIM
jgi:hypothetical protein